MRISRDPILSKAFKDMSDAERELAKLEIGKIIGEPAGNAYSSDVRQALAVSLFAAARGNLGPEVGLGDIEAFEEIPEPDPFEKRDLFGENFKKVALPKERQPVRQTSFDAKRKPSQDSELGFGALVKNLNGRSR